MGLTAVRGALGFLSRLPIGRDQRAWEAFGATPATFPCSGYVIGALVALPLLVPGPSATVAVLFVVGVYAVTGITHVDGAADLGDAVVAHGTDVERREIMTDAAVGTGGALAVALVLFGLGAASIALAELPRRAVLLVVVAEVGAKTGMALLVCLGAAAHDGLGSAFTTNASVRSVGPVLLVALPATVVAWPRVVPSVAAFLAAILTALVVLRWARANLGGVSGDVIGATNEFARVVALHAGVMAWTLW